MAYAPIGYYQIRMTDRKTKLAQSIGDFMVAEFTPPEFEQKVKIPAMVKLNQPIKAIIKASRMNGVALKNASVKLHYKIERNYQIPDAWPDGYEFMSWRDFDKNKNGSESIKPKTFALDSNGTLAYLSKPVLSTIPFGNLNLISEITADDGEVQYQQKSSIYFSREHFIGTRFNQESKRLEVIAIDKNGTLITDLAVTVNRVVESSDKRSLVHLCHFKALPASCSIPYDKNRGGSRSVEFELASGSEEHRWYRTIYISEPETKNSEPLASLFKLSTKTKQLVVGDTISINLQSSESGEATFILQAGNIQKVWKQSVNVGGNYIKLKVGSSWQPYARVYVAMPVNRDEAEIEIKEKINIAYGEQIKNNNVRRLTRYLREQRFLKDQLELLIQSKLKPLEVELNIDAGKVNAGSTIRLKVSSNKSAESQIWLVNEAVLALMNKDISNYDYQSKVNTAGSFERELNGEALSDRLIIDFLMGGSEPVSESDGMMMKMRGNSRAMRFSSKIKRISNDKLTKDDFSQSVWLDTVFLKKDQTTEIKIKLPQLIGRWKLISLTATPQLVAIDSLSISTSRDIEYFFDAPQSILKTDQTKFAITQINRLNSPVRDKLTLWLNGESISTVDVSLKPKQYKRVIFEPPSLVIGDNTLELTSEKFTDFRTYHSVNIKPASYQQQKTWLVDTKSLNKVAIPQSMVKNSLKISQRAGNISSPDWQGLLKHDKNYPHQCWEQTISRAVSYHFNPNSKESWKEGGDTIKKSLSKSSQFELYGGMYSYFPEQSPELFLTAYTYLVHAWLAESEFKLSIDEEKLIEANKGIIQGNVFESANSETKSMALLALAENKAISLDEAKELRQAIGTSNAYSAALQALALKSLGADRKLYLSDLKALSKLGYQDENNSLFNQNDHKCFAALAFDEGTRERQNLIMEIVNYQQKEGVFGSTFTNAVCTVLLKDKLKGDAQFTSVDFKTKNNEITYEPFIEAQYWLRMNYAQDLDSLIPTANGLQLQREIFVDKNSQWVKITEVTPLKVGDIIKVKILLKSPVAIEHVAIIDSIAGGFEAINPTIGNQLYANDLEDAWLRYNRIEIRNGNTHWYARYLSEGDTYFSYYARVRYPGIYKLAPTKAEAMYRNDVNALSGVFELVIESE